MARIVGFVAQYGALVILVVSIGFSARDGDVLLAVLSALTLGFLAYGIGMHRGFQRGVRIVHDLGRDIEMLRSLAQGDNGDA